MRTSSLYHRILRVSALTLALLLLFDSGSVLPWTREYSLYTQRYIASSVGASANVELNEYNQFTSELAQRQRELDARERDIDARAVDTSNETNDYSTYILSAILLALLTLIVLNYVLDWLRARRAMRPQKLADAVSNTT